MTIGTAVAIGHSSNQKGTFFLSCAHGIEEGNVNTVTIDRRQYPVRLLARKYSGPVDLSLFFLDGHKTEPTYQIAEESPGFNEPAWMVGFPVHNRGRYRETRGKIDRTNVVGYEYQFNRRALQSESGGPLFINGFRVVGIVSAVHGSSTLVTTVPKIRSFVTSAIGGIPNCRKQKPTEPPPVQPLPGIAGLLKRVEALEAKLAALESREPRKGDRGERGHAGADGKRGPDGPQGVPGPARTVTIIFEDLDGNELLPPETIPPGKDKIRVPVERFKTK